ncbi:MAG: HAD hydrolase family protein [Nitrospirota bacterium]|nr:HAD hydrolase family protein [Nitrospirota bacterium]
MRKVQGTSSSRKEEKTVRPLKKNDHPRSLNKPKKVFEELRLFATDVDGVLTDAGMYYGESGEELKKFHTRDGMGIKLLQAQGLVTAIITMENTKIVARRGEKLGIPEVFQGAKDKVAVLCYLSEKYGIPFGQMAYMGDDVNDVEALKTVGYAAAPADCVEQVRQVVHYVCKKNGGEGAVREVIDKILAAKGLE